MLSRCTSIIILIITIWQIGTVGGNQAVQPRLEQRLWLRQQPRRRALHPGRQQCLRRPRRGRHRFRPSRWKRCWEQIEPAVQPPAGWPQSGVELLDTERCAALFRQVRWADGLCCTYCGSGDVRSLPTPTERGLWRYRCLVCSAQAGRRVTFSDTTGTPFAGSHLSPAHWLLGLFQILGGSSTLGLADDLNVTARTGTRWMRIVQVAIWELLGEELTPLDGENEIDEIYVISGWKGCPGGIALDRPARRRGLKKRGRGNWEGDKPPVTAIVQREGQLRVRVCRNLQQETFRPWLLTCLRRGATVYTDSYSIYQFLTDAGFRHRTVNHSAGEYARGRVHVNTTEGLWSLLRSYLRAFRGVSKVYLPLYVALFAFIHQHRHLTTWQQTGVLLYHLCRCDGTRLRQIVRSNTVIQVCNLPT